MSLFSSLSCLASAVSLLSATVLFADEPLEITIDAGQTHQRIEGFGTCVFPHNQKTRETYAAGKIHEVFVKDIGLNILRVNYSFHTHREVEDADDINTDSIQTDFKADIYTDFAKAIRKLDPNIRIIGTVWTPPIWMKVSEAVGNGLGRGNNSAITAQSYHNSKLGRDDPNRVKPDHVQHFVNWCAAVAEFWAEQDIEFYALSPGNEVRFSQWYVSCVWTADDYVDMLPKLEEALDDAGLGETLIFGPETMTHLIQPNATGGYIKAIFNDAKARRALDRFATHGYYDGQVGDMTVTSNRALLNALNEAGSDKPIWVTEGGTGEHGWPEAFSFEGLAVGIHNALAGGNVSAFVPWQISGPHASTHNLVVDDVFAHKAAAMAHFARAIPVDAHRIQAQPAFDSVLTSAYQHFDTGEIAIVLINPHDEAHVVELKLKALDGLKSLQAFRTDETKVYADEGELAVAGNQVEVTLQPHSALSLVGQTNSRSASAPNAAPPVLSEVRRWTSADRSGHFDGALVSVHEGGVVVRMNAHQSTVDVPVRFAQLSAEDRAWVEAFMARR
ncbi:MAG: hypothetical protein ACFB20_04625 [Opitutales bacterium]